MAIAPAAPGSLGPASSEAAVPKKKYRLAIKGPNASATAGEEAKGESGAEEEETAVGGANQALTRKILKYLSPPTAKTPPAPGSLPTPANPVGY